MGIREDLTGQTFNQLTVLKETSPSTSPIKWECICSCGNTAVARASSLKNGNTKSCGCFAKESTSKRFKTHGARETRLYQTYTSMQARCNIPSSSAYSIYGGRGIKVCTEWGSFEPFQLWAMTNGYVEGLSLDRINTNGNYSPDNCRWVSQLVQVRNRNPFKNSTSKYIGVSWDTQYSKWSANIGINYKVVHLGRYVDELAAAKARDSYIKQNNLEGFTLNFK